MSAIELSRVLAACLLVLMPGMAGAGPLSDSEAKKFLNARGCNACHGVDEARIGPPFIAVAARYSRSADAVDNLGRKIRFGGSGSWGLVPMISYPGLSDEEIEAITRWILALKSAGTSAGSGR